MSVIALVISIVALGLTIWQAWQARTHNRLAMRPFLVSRQKKGRVTGGVSITYEFINSGLGPAIIEELILSLGGEKITASDPVEEALRRCIGGKIPYVLKSSSIPSRRYCLKPQEEYMFAEVFFPALTPKGEITLGELLRPSDLKIHYSSFYGEKFTFPEPTQKDNQPPEPTAMSVTPPAAQEPRQP